MAGSMKDIKLRINSVKSTMQITKAMELVASSKLRRAKERVEQTRPYFNTFRQTLNDIAYSNTEFTSTFVVERPVKKACYVVIAGDRGLAGGYNSNLFKKAAAEMEGKPAVILPIGKKTVEYFSKKGYEILSTKFAVVENIDLSDCFDIGAVLAEAFRKGEFDELYVVYTKFLNMLTQEPKAVKVLPISYDMSLVDDQTSKSLIVYEPSSEEVFDTIVPQYVAGLVYGAVAESFASEVASRRTAMEAASKNAGEMIEDLDLKYNRARQAAITQEITEIVSGAEAL